MQRRTAGDAAGVVRDQGFDAAGRVLGQEVRSPDLVAVASRQGEHRASPVAQADRADLSRVPRLATDLLRDQDEVGSPLRGTHDAWPLANRGEAAGSKRVHDHGVVPPGIQLRRPSRVMTVHTGAAVGDEHCRRRLALGRVVADENL